MTQQSEYIRTGLTTRTFTRFRRTARQHTSLQQSNKIFKVFKIKSIFGSRSVYVLSYQSSSAEPKVPSSHAPSLYRRQQTSRLQPRILAKVSVVL